MKDNVIRLTLTVLGIIGAVMFAVSFLPPVTKMISGFIVTYAPPAWHNDRRSFYEAVLRDTALSGIIFCALSVLTGLGILQKKGRALCDYIEARYDKLYFPVLLSPVVFRFVVIALFAVNIPVSEDWIYILRYMPRFADGVLSLSDFANEARYTNYSLFFSHGALSALGVWTRLNIVVMLLIGSSLWIAPYLCMAFSLTGRNKRPGGLLLAAGIGFLLNGIARREETIRPEHCYVTGLALCFSVFAYYFYTKKSPFAFFAGLLCSIFAFYSYSLGMFVYPVLIAVTVLCALCDKNKPFFKIIFFAAAFSLLWFVNVRINPYANSPASAVAITENLPERLMFFIFQQGSWFGNPVLAPVFGALFTAVSAALLRYLIIRKKIREYMFPLCVIGTGYAFVLGLAAARFGFATFFHSNYSIGSVYILTGLAYIVYKEKITAFMAREILCLLIASAALSNFALFSAYYVKKERTDNLEIIRTYKDRDIKDFDIIREEGRYFKSTDDVAVLEKYGWLGFPKIDSNNPEK